MQTSGNQILPAALSAVFFALLMGAIAIPEVHAATFVVDSVADAPDSSPGDASCLVAGGDCTLRAAIEEANALPNDAAPDQIHFEVPGTGPHVISPASALPSITDPIVIDGYTQPGASENTQSSGTDAALSIVLDGSAAGPADGLDVAAGGSTVRGLVVHGWTRFDPTTGGSGIRITGAGGSRIEGCFLGTDATGLTAVPNEAAGVTVDFSDNNLIGGVAPAARNLVSGNVVLAIDITGAGNRVEGNLVGLDATGTEELPNERGIRVNGPATIIGGTIPGAGNVSSGNGQYGVNVLSEGDDSLIAGNRVGTDALGVLDRGNGGDGIRVSSGALRVVIGGATAAAANLVSGNNHNGIQLTGADEAFVYRNRVGTDASGLDPLGNGLSGIVVDSNRVLVGPDNLIAFNQGDGVHVYSSSNQHNSFIGNQIHSNGELGIDIENNGVTPNDEDDSDIGGNGRQNFPELSEASSDGIATSVSGALVSTPSTLFRIDVYAGPTCDASGFGEGEHYRGVFLVETDETGLAEFSDVVPSPVLGGWEVTATATPLDGGTSEFSSCIVASGPATTTTTSTTTSTSTTIDPTSTTTSTTVVTGSSTTTTIDPGGTTTTSTTTITGTTTSTTIAAPRPCNLDGECDDGNGCTVDSCVFNQCAYVAVEGIPGVVCHAENLRSLGEGEPCTIRLAARLGRIDRRYDRAMRTSSENQCRRLVRRARRPTRRLLRNLRRKVSKGCLTPGPTADALLAEAAALSTAALMLSPDDVCQR